jgi:hypothetical protein
MGNDPLEPPVIGDDCLSDPDRMIDAAKNARIARRPNVGVLRTMFGTIVADAAAPAKDALVNAEQSIQRPSFKSSFPAPN